jgi:hypothetical protein
LQSPQALRKAAVSMAGRKSPECLLIISVPTHTVPAPATASPLAARVWGLPESSGGGARSDRLVVRRIADEDDDVKPPLLRPADDGVEPLLFLGRFRVDMVTSNGSPSPGGSDGGGLLSSSSSGAERGRVARLWTLKVSTLDWRKGGAAG